MSSFRHLIDLNDFTLEQWDEIIDLALQIKADPQSYYGRCQNKILATLFYEPSTRTQMSFQTAMLRLGGQVIGFDNPSNSSVAKGESLADTIRIVSGYADLIVIRNPKEGSAKAGALYAGCPVINAGDGGHLHPTQTLTDLVTLRAEKGHLDHLRIGLCGDLKYGRTVHSLIKAMCHFHNKFVLISTKELTVPDYIKEIIVESGCEYEEISKLEDAIGSLDVLYMTRIQRERFSTPGEYARQKDVYVLDQKKLALAKPDLTVLHPLPRVDEITVEVDEDPRACYFHQAVYGMYARMALILYMLQNQSDAKPVALCDIHNELQCTNPACITQSEKYLPHAFSSLSDMYVCDYCDERILK